MYILLFFTDSSEPKTGLSPTLKVREIPSGNVVVDAEAMTELGDGFYYYDFLLYDYTKDYGILGDGGPLLASSERYIACSNENFVEDIKEGIGESSILKRVVGLLHENFYIFNPQYDPHGNLSAASVRLYSDGASVGTENNILAEYQIYAPSSGPGKFTIWKQVKTS